MNINYKLNDVFSYSYENQKTTYLNLIFDKSSEEHKQIINIKGKYLINIYEKNEENEENNSISYKAYAILIKLDKEIEDQTFEIGGKNIKEDEIPNHLNDLAFLKFTFNSKGEIKDINIPKNANTTLISYLLQFIESIVPEINNESLPEKNNNILRTTSKGQLGDCEDSNDEKSSDSYFNNGKIEKVKINRTSILYSNNKNQIDFTQNSNFTEETKKELISVKDNFVKNITQSFKIDFNLKYSEENEEFTNKLKNYFNKIQFEKYEKIFLLIKEYYQ